MNDLEKELPALRPRRAPLDLRREVLARYEREIGRPTLVQRWKSFFGAMYPGHGLTVSLAMVWLVILGLHLDTPVTPGPIATPVSLAQMREVKQEREWILALLETPRFEADWERGSFSIPREDLKSN